MCERALSVERPNRLRDNSTFWSTSVGSVVGSDRLSDRFYDAGAERVCGSEAELPETYASTFRGADPSDETKTLLPPEAEQITSQRLGVPIQVMDYCAPARVDRDSVTVDRYGIEPSPVPRETLP